jgi:dihydroxy-acid dehydratase
MAAVRDGDIIVIDIAGRTLDVDISEETMKERLAGWSAPKPRYATGVLGKYARLVSSASLGAVTG